MLKKLADLYATLKKTHVIAATDHGDSITFVLASGPKLHKTETELNDEIAAMQKEVDRELNQSKPFEQIEEAVREEQPKRKSKSKK